MSMYRLSLTSFASLTARVATAWLAAVFAAAALLAVVPAPASAAHAFLSSFGAPGVEAGQLSSPAAVAANQETGDVYVADRGNHRVDEFTASGTFVMAFGANVGGLGVDTCTLICEAGTAGAEPGEFEAPAFIAVDNSSGPSKGDVYVGDDGTSSGAGGKSFISKFTAEGALINSWGTGGQITAAPTEDTEDAGSSCPYGTISTCPFHALGGIAVDSSGTLYVADDVPNTYFGEPEARIFKFAQDGTFELEFQTVKHPYYDNKVPVVGESGIAVDSKGDIYFTNGNLGEENGSGRLLGEDVIGGPVTGIAVDPANNDVYVDSGTEVVHYGPSGNFIESFGSPDITGGEGIAVDGTSGIYVADTAAGSIDFLPLVGPFEVAAAATDVTSTSATLNGRVTPISGGNVTACQFEYVSEAAYEPNAEDPYSAGGTAPCSPATPFSSSTAVSAEVSGLLDGTIYHLRILATAADGTTTYSADHSFLVGGPAVSLPSASSVTDDSATLEAQVDPDGVGGAYHFEYLTEAEFQADSEQFTGPDQPISVPMPEDSLAGTQSIAAVQLIQDLQPHTVYHYRVVAHNGQGVTEPPSQTFTTQVGGGELTLADGRHWEMVSPPNKVGALIYPLGSQLFEALNVQASSNGNAIVFMTNTPTEVNPTGDGQGVYTLGTRGANEWSTQVITSPHTEAAGVSVGKGAEYDFFSEDLSLGYNHIFGNFDQLSPEATEQTPYLRTVYEHGNVNAHCLSSCYQPLVTAANTPPGTKFGETTNGICSGHNGGCGPEFAGGTRDLSHVLIKSGAALTKTPVGNGLYEWGAGELKLVSVLPEEEGGGAVPGLLGNNSEDFQHVISDDGSRVIWRTYRAGLFLRDTSTGKEETIKLDPSNGESVTANSDLSRIFFVEEEPLVPGAKVGYGGSDLYEYNLNAPIGSRLTDLTLLKNPSESGGVGVILGVSEDGSYVYYSAHGDLFEYHDGQTTLIAPENEHDTYYNLVGRTSRVSPNGHWLAFQSSLDLTGYDTHDALTGESDGEVYLYNGETHKLVCGSCNPTGARPTGRVINESEGILLTDANGQNYGRVSALIPPWSRFDVTYARYQSRYLSNSGRLFFDSNEALVPQDVNGTMDVYEYEPPEVGSCTTSSVTFSERSGGCVGLISSGTSPHESSFLDASESGGDVFFLTTAKLQPQDVDSAYDIYDAHECSTGEPCYSAAPVQPPACDTSESCKAAETPQPEIFGSPSSETFSGAGNITSTTPVVVEKTTKEKTVKCKKGSVKKNNKCVKRKSKKHAKKRDRRASR